MNIVKVLNAMFEDQGATMSDKDLARASFRANLSSAKKGVPKPEEVRAKQGAAMKAAHAANPRPPLTAEQKARIEAGKRAAEERRRNGDPTIRPHKSGWKLSPETVAKQSAASKGRKMGEAARAKISQANTGRTLSPEQKAKLAAGRKAEAAAKREAGIKRKLTPEHIAALAEGRKRAKERKLEKA